MRVAYLTPLLLVPMLSAQDFRATLNGRVTDPHNAAIAGAVVLLRDAEKGETLRQITDHEGNYVFALIQPGNYELNVAHPGFKNYKRSGLTLNGTQAGSNHSAYVPPVDCVQEFNIQTNAYDAQYGKTAGGVMNAVLKSGSNTLHGSAYEFLRRNWLDANSFQNNARGAPKDGHSLDQYGALVNGPVIPNRTFYMVNYERYNEKSPQPLVL